jgi:hypothetical protein
MKLSLILALSMVSVPAAAQTEADPVSTARIHLGPLGVTPAIAVQNIGIDTNVFNEAENPKQDFTATVSPQLETWLRLGRARLNVDGSMQAVYFKRYSSQSSVGGNGSATLEFRLNRLTAWVGGGVFSTRERASVEIDTRAHRVETTLTVGSNARLTGKTTVGVLAERRKIDFGDANVVESALGEQLNRYEAKFTTSLEHSVTTLTTIVLRANVQRDTFDSSSGRDSQRLRIAPGVQFRPNPVISGSAFVGYLRFDTLGGVAPPFSGTYAAIDLSYTLRGMTRLGIQSLRDVEYSFDASQTYYLSTGITGSVTQALGPAWTVAASAGRQRLDYHERAGVAIGAGPRQESVNTYGTRIAYQLSPTIELGLGANYSGRHANEKIRNYEGLRAGGFVTYGLGAR